MTDKARVGIVPHLETELSRPQQSEGEGGGDGDDCDSKLNHFYMIRALKGPRIYFRAGDKQFPQVKVEFHV